MSALSKLILDLAALQDTDCPNIGKGRKLLEKQLVTTHIRSLKDLEFLSPKIISDGFKGSLELKVIAAVTLLAKFCRH